MATCTDPASFYEFLKIFKVPTGGGGATASGMRAYLGTAQLVSPSLPTQIRFDSTNFNIGYTLDPSTGNISPKVNGIHGFVLDFEFNSPTLEAIGVTLFVIKNGTTVHERSYTQFQGNSYAASLAWEDNLVTTDVIQFSVIFIGNLGSGLVIKTGATLTSVMAWLVETAESFPMTATPLRVRYVSPIGSDSNNGTQDSPWLTYDTAVTNIVNEGILDNTHPYKIVFDCEYLTPPTFYLYPNIHLEGQGPGVTVIAPLNGGMNMDPACDGTVSGDSCIIKNLQLSGGITFNNSSFSSCNLDITFDNVLVTNNIIFVNKYNMFITQQNNTTLGLSPAAAIYDGLNNFTSRGSIFSAASTIFRTVYKSLLVDSLGDTWNTALSVQDSGGFGVTASLASGSRLTSLLMTGSNSTLKVDATTYPLSETVSAGTLQLITDAVSINAGFTPTNYSPIDPSVKGHLQGIDNALGSAGGATLLQTVYYSEKGNDISGTGTQSKPFASVNAALTYALTLSPTLANPIVIFGDAGTYPIDTAAMVYPNIIWAGEGVIWTSGFANSITLAPNSAWSASASIVKFNGPTVDSTLFFNLDTTGITDINCNFTYENFEVQGNHTFKLGNAAHTANHQLNANAFFATADSSASTFDGVVVNAFGAHQIAPVGTVTLLATHSVLTIISIGNCGIGSITGTTNNSHQLQLFALAGDILNFSGGVNLSGTAGMQLQLDSTTLPLSLQSFFTGNIAHLDYTNLSAKNFNSQYQLTDGSTVPWNANLAPSALWEPNANGHTLSNVTNSTAGQVYSIDILNPGGITSVAFDTGYIFPLGPINLNTASNAHNPLQFYCSAGNQMICITPPTTILTLTDSSTVSYQINNNGSALLTLTGSGHTINVPSNMVTGEIFTLFLTTAGNSFSFAAGYLFPSGQPISNTVSGAVDIYTFRAISSSQCVLTTYTSSVPNWDNYNTSNNIGPFLASMKTIAEATSASGLDAQQIPGTSNYLQILQNSTTTIYAYVFQFDGNGVPIVPDISTWTTITTSGAGTLSAGPIYAAITTDGQHAIVSFVQNISAVNCSNLAPLYISGTTLTLGTIVQVRPTEGAEGSCGGALVPLDTSNFGLVLRTTTGNTLWAYQCSVSGTTPTITIGSSPLSIETGTGANLDAKMAPLDSTHSMMLWMSLASGTTNYVYPSKITWNGISSTPSISTGTALSSTGSANTSNGKALHIYKNNANSTYICQYFESSAIKVQAVTSASTPAATGTGYATDTSIVTNTSYSLMPDNNHLIIGGTNNTFTNVFAFWLLSIDSGENITLNKKFMMPFGVNVAANTFATVINSGQVMLGYPDAASAALVKMMILKT